MERPNTTGTAISCRGLQKRYGMVEALRGVDLEMPAGSIYGFLGPNGCGKTTTIKILLGLTMANGGECSMLGTPVQQYSAEARAEVGYLAQDPAYPRWMTGREVLTFAGELYPTARRPVAERTAEALELVDLAGAADRQCGGYSGGMRQRLGIAQAIAGDPRLIIVDEPTAGLDPEERHRFYRLLAELAERRTVLLSTHIVEDVAAIERHAA